MNTLSDIYDIVAVGAGPSNLSLAALAEPIENLTIAVLDRQNTFEWHPGLMLAGVSVGTAPVKDLVTLIDPTNRHSFLNFLVEQRRIYRFLIANGATVSRREFSQYYAWAADRLDSVSFGVEVRRIDHDGEVFLVEASDGMRRAHNIVLGTGQQPYVPEFAKPLLCDDVFHASDFLYKRPELAGRDVLLVGGGQSATEVAYHIVAHDDRLPRHFTWVSGRGGFLPLDNSPFSNDWFNPHYVEYFQSLDATRRRELLSQHVLASDGAWEPLLSSIYRRLYALDYFEDRPLMYDLLAGHRVVDMGPVDSGYEITIYSPDLNEKYFHRANVVILATGYQAQIPDFLQPIRHHLVLDDGWYSVNQNFKVNWDGPAQSRVYVQNGARQSHGVADSNLSVSAWRSARIINDVCERRIYQTDRNDITLTLRRTNREPIE